MCNMKPLQRGKEACHWRLVTRHEHGLVLLVAAAMKAQGRSQEDALSWSRLQPGHGLKALDGAAAEGAQGRGQAPRAQLVCALPAQPVAAAADADLQRSIHADGARLHRCAAT